MYKTRWKLTLLLLIVATLFYIQLECYVVYTGQRNSGNNQINNRRKNNFYSNVVWLSGAVFIIKSYLLSFLTLYHVSPRFAFIAGMSPPGMVILNSLPKATFSSASLSSQPITFNSSTNWVPAAPPLTAVLVSATIFDICLTVFLSPHQLFSWPWFF